MTAEIEIWRVATLEAARGPAAWLDAGMAGVFRRAAARWPDDPAEQRHFQNLWLDDYLRFDRDLAYAVIAGEPQKDTGTVAGYLVASRSDQATEPRFKTLSYLKDFAALRQAYPVHLHINLDAAYRNSGIGRRLIAALASDLKAEGVLGIHIVTARAERNVRFYETAGFCIAAQTVWNGRELVLMGRKL